MAQEEGDPLILVLSKDFGFAAAGKIQGRFKLKVQSPGEELERVDFYIDGEIVHTSSESPYQYQFNTADYSLGEHAFFVKGFRSDGTIVSSSKITREFLSAEKAWESVGRITIPLFGVILVLSLLGAIGPALLARRKEFVLGEYGVAGGAVCPRCQLPNARNLLAPNLLVGKLQRCPHCGKWAVVPQASPQVLEMAEERYAQDGAGETPAMGGDAEYRQLLDESRYE